MAFFSRTRVATLGVAALILGCGHLAFEEIPNSEAPGVDAGDERPPVEVIDASGGTDASMVDAGCVGPSCPGTYVSGTTGSDTNPGTGAAPVKTIGQAMKIAVALGGSQKVYVAAAHYPEKITLVEKVDLLGGYECKATPCTWTRDIAMNDTVINNTDYEGVLALKTITRQTLFEGLQVVGRPGAPDAGLGSVGVTLNGGSPTIRRCRIAGADTTGGIPNAKRSIGVELIAPSNSTEGALLDRNSISAGSATNDSIGILFDNRPAAPPLSVAVATVTNNTIRGGAAPFTSGVVAWNSGAATLLRGNDITGGTSGGGSANDSSWGIAVNSAMTIDANRINVDQVNAGSCQQNTMSFCGGIRSGGSTTFITNNVVFGAKAPRSAAVLLTESEQAAGVVVLNSNTLDGSGNAAFTGSMSTAIALRIGFGTNTIIGSIRNNILLGGVNKDRFGIYEETTPGKTGHPSAIDNNDFYNPPPARNDFVYRRYNGMAPVDVPFGQLGTVTNPVPSGNINDDPRLDAKYHLSTGSGSGPASPCIDKGTTLEAPPRDMDGDSRPKGVASDIGADEAK